MLMPTETALSLLGVCQARLRFFLGTIRRLAVVTPPLPLLEVETGTSESLGADEEIVEEEELDGTVPLNFDAGPIAYTVPISRERAPNVDLRPIFFSQIMELRTDYGEKDNEWLRREQDDE